MQSSDIITLAPVIPVVVLDDPSVAVPLARALARGGIPVVELTLRTPRALEAIRAIADDVPEVTIGAGTVTRPEDAEASLAAGARFVVSPGAGPRLFDALDGCPVPVLPGIATASEAIAAWERGYTTQKFFPAESSGGVGMLRALAGPLPQLRFCPTGGIGPANARSYLDLPNVKCVGGSWLTPTSLIDAHDWAGIEALAAEAALLATP